ncbi:MAG: BamA/TamA family outer membrane protein [Bacteroidales bacterium]
MVYQPVLTESSRNQMEMYMHSKGYFNARVDATEQYRKKKAEVTYSVQGNTPYTIRNIDYQIEDPHLASFIFADTTNALVQGNQRYDTEIFQQERERITRHLKNQGFFAFSKEFILFQVDSTLNSHQVDLFMVVLNPGKNQMANTSNTPAPRHKRYILDHVFIYPDHSPFRPQTSFLDTTTYFTGNREQQMRYTFMHNGPLRIGHKTLVQNILLEPGEFYKIRNVERTYNYLSGLRNFRFINVQFSSQQAPQKGEPNDTIAYLDANVLLARSPANAFTVEAEGINSSGNLGVAGNLLFQNRNMFRGAEILNLRLKGALEVSGETTSGAVLQRFPFNTLELGAEISMDFPKLLSPIPLERISKNARPKSTILSGINYRQRPDYTRYIFNISYGLEWSENPLKRHYLHPLEISSINIFNDSLLQAKIPDNNPLILSRFKNHLIAGSKYTYTYNTQNLNTERNFMYFRGNFEAAGNLLNVITKATGSSRDASGSATLFNIPYAQYLKADVDLRHYWMLAGNTSLAVRAMAGMGVPYGNTNVLPFIKSYYGGGANGIRAWRIYSLGPGGHQDTQQLSFDKYGDIKLEANIEYRFPIYSFWHGAFFVDAGNVWFIEENPQFPNGSFAADRFYKEIAIGTGLGLRMDFGFFVVRVDMGVPIRDPGLPSGQRWMNNLPKLSQYNLNLGIGYPF